VTLHTKHAPDDEERRLFSVYEASNAKEHTAASKLLNPHHGFSDPAYMKLLGELQLSERNATKTCSQSQLIIKV
jgi:hypothetical protein